MKPENIQSSSDQEKLRERLNPQWRQQKKMHEEELCICEETKGMGAREIVQRALRVRYGYEPKRSGRGIGLEKWFR